MLSRALVVEVVADKTFRAADPVRAERWQVCGDVGIRPPDDLIRDEEAATGSSPVPVIETLPGVQVATVHPEPDGPVDFPYHLTITAPHLFDEDLEVIVTDDVPAAAAEPILQMIAGAWDQVPEFGRRFVFEEGQGYELVMAEIPAERLGLPDNYRYVQLITQDAYGRWPWDEKREMDAPMILPDWRPSDEEPLEIRPGRPGNEVPEDFETLEIV